MKTHKHRCGYDGVDDAVDRMLTMLGMEPLSEEEKSEAIEPDGCGLVFEHENDCFGNTEAHVCPNCGRETWVKYFGDLKAGEGRIKNV